MSKPQGTKGIFIALEGIDGSGKSTAMDTVASILKNLGYSVAKTTEPTTDNELGSLIRSLLASEDKSSDAAMALLFAADRQMHSDRITKRIGEWDGDKPLAVVTDRYMLSGLAYQTANLPWPYVANINMFNKRPDITLYFDIPVNDALHRINATGRPKEMYEKDKFLGETKIRYERAFRMTDTDPVRIDASQSLERVNQELTYKLTEAVKKLNRKGNRK